ncbi:hypothetical protein [Halobaculum marinum]|uniref:DUF8128 domain-containing protein n=1 Tax=Halobaculum marinum TaxID=3031996 RepID=A0ABD5WQ73_9EURY|nr:hypothetical protein [Halobaculum sp. DT55]
MRLPLIGKNSYRALQIDENLQRELQAYVTERDNTIIQSLPFKEGPGQEYGPEVIKNFQRDDVSRGFFKWLRGKEKSPGPFSFEIWYDNGSIKFLWSVPNEFWYKVHRELLAGNYPRVELNRKDQAFPAFEPGDHVAGGHLTLNNNIFHPIKGIGGDSHGQFEPGKAALRNITSAMIGQNESTAIAQVIFTPAGDNWRRRIPFRADADKVSRALRQGRYVHRDFRKGYLEDPTEKDLRIAKAISDTKDETAFHVNIRYFVFSDKPDFVTKAAAQIGNAYSATYQNRDYGQRFREVPKRGRGLKKELKAAVGRDWRRYTGENGPSFPLTPAELGGLAHLPNAEIDTPNVQYTRKALSSQAPADASRKPESISPLPMDRYTVGKETTETALSSSKPALPDPELDDETDVEPAPEGTPQLPGEVAPDDEVKAARERVAASKSVTGEATFQEQPQRPSDRLEGEDKDLHLKAVELWKQGELTYEILLENFDEETAKSKKALIEAEIAAQQAEEQRRLEEDRLKHEVDNLPVPARHNDASSETFISTVREWCLDPHTGQDRAYEVKAITDEGDVYMGYDVQKELFDSHEDHPDQPIWLGYIKDNRVGFHEIGIEENAWFRHFTQFGMTGMGKSTEQKNIMNQVVRKGYGLCYIDPKGDTVDEFINEIPEHRMDDVIWIEPGSTEFDKTVGINFLEAKAEPGTMAFDREVTSIVDDLTAILKGGDYWGPKMEGITTNIARAMIRSPKPFTLTDMYHVLMSSHSRRAFADMIAREGRQLSEAEEMGADYAEDMENIHTYTKQIAEMGDDEVDAVIRRIQSWVEDPIARGIVAHREGTVNITEAVENGKIILVKIPIDSDELKEVVSTAVMRRVWSAIQARKEKEADREPYFTFIDELDWVATEEMDLEAMLSKARSKKMGVGLANQNPSQLPEKIQKQMFANSRTVTSFGVGEADDARLIAERMGEEVDYSLVEEIPRFTMFVRVLLQGEQDEYLSDALPVETFADYPPVRTDREADEHIEESLEKYGVEPLEADINETAMLIHNLGNDDQTQRQFLMAIREVQLERGSEYVALGAVNRAFENRTGKPITGYPNGLSIERDHIRHYVRVEDEHEIKSAKAADGGVQPDVPAEELLGEETDEQPPYREIAAEGRGDTHEIPDDEGAVTLTDAGLAFILSADEAQFTPSDEHREMLAQGFDWFSQLGFRVSIIAQQAKADVADAEGELPGEVNTTSRRLMRESLKELEEEFPVATELAGNQDITIEAEKSLRKPAGPLNNLARGANQGRKVMFLVPDGRAHNRQRDAFANRLHIVLADPPMVRSRDHWVNDEGEEVESDILYNTPDFLELSDEDEADKFALIRESGQSVWEWNGSQLTLYDGKSADAKQRGQIGPDAIDNPSVNAFSAWARYDKYEDEWVVYREKGNELLYDTMEELEEDWKRVRRPFLPQAEFTHGPESVDWEIATIATDHELINSPEDAMPQLYDGESLSPLIPEEEWTPSFRERFPTELIRGFDKTDGELDDEIADDTTTEPPMTDNTIQADALLNGEKLPRPSPQYTSHTDYGGKDPFSRVFWEQAWDAADTDHAQHLQKEQLKKALAKGNAMKDNRDRAIYDASQMGHIVETELGFFLAPPQGRHAKLVLDGERDRFANRYVWENVWADGGQDRDRSLPRKSVVFMAKGVEPFIGQHNTEQRVAAAIEVALAAGYLEEVDGTDNSVRITEREVPQEWKTVWAKIEGDPEKKTGTPRDAFPSVVKGVLETVSKEDAAVEVDRAFEANILFQEGNMIALNAADVDGPEIDWDAFDTFHEDGGDDPEGDSDTADSEPADERSEPADDGEGPAEDEVEEAEPAEEGVEEQPDEAEPTTGQSDTATAEGAAPDDEQVVVDDYEADGQSENEEPTEAVDEHHEDEPEERATEATTTDSAADQEEITVAEGASPEDVASAIEGADGDDEDDEEDLPLIAPDDTDPEEPVSLATPSDDSQPDEEVSPTSEGDADTPVASDDPTSDADAPGDEEPTTGLLPTTEPDGWEEAFDAAVDYYHDQLDRTVKPNGWYNALLDHVDDQYRTPCGEAGQKPLSADSDDTGAWPEHDHYHDECPHCRVEGECDHCHDEAAVVRVDAIPCSEHMITNADCDDCTVAAFCAECVAEHEQAVDDARVVPIEVTADADEVDGIHSPTWATLKRLGVSATDLVELNKQPPTSDDEPMLMNELEMGELGDEAGVDLEPDQLPPEERAGYTAPANSAQYADETHAEATTIVEFEPCFSHSGNPQPAECDDCCTIETSEPFTYLPETQYDYFTGPSWDVSDDDLAIITQDLESHSAHRHAGQAGVHHHGRGWSEETVESARVGWVPSYKRAGVEELLEQGFTFQQIIATGLFRPDYYAIRDHFASDEYDGPAIEAIREYLESKSDTTVPEDIKGALAEMFGADLREAIEEVPFPDAAPQLSAVEMLRSRWKGRYLFPYFDADGTAIHAISRTQKGRHHPRDLKPDAKYQKLPAGYDGVYTTEPIYGEHSLEEGRPVVITEGIADAIAANAHGIPCLSPVTTKFKNSHVEELERLIEKYDIPTAYLVQDNERATIDPIAEADRPSAEVLEAMVEGDTENIPKTYQRSPKGPITECMEINSVAPGEDGAIRTAARLEQAGISSFIVELPRVGADKVDLDDYLSDKLYEFAPPLPHLSALVETWRRDEDVTLLEQTDTVEEYGDITRLPTRALTHAESQSTLERDWLESFAKRRAYDAAYVPQIEAYLEEHHSPEDEDGTTPAPVDISSLTDDESQSLTQYISQFPHFDYTELTQEEMEAIRDSPVEFATMEYGRFAAYGEAKTNAAKSAYTAIIDADAHDWAGDEHFRPTFADGELGPFLTLGRHVAVASAEGVNRSVAPLPNSASSEAAHGARVEPLFDGHEIQRATDHPGYAAIMQAETTRVRNDEWESSFDEEDGKPGSGRTRNELYDQRMRDLVPTGFGRRGTNPLGHKGESENYFVLLDSGVAYDHKRDAAYTPLSYLACAVNVRDLNHPEGRFTDEETLHTWVGVKEKLNVLSDDAQVPRKALMYAALEMGVATEDDFEEVTRDGPNGQYTRRELPAELYRETILNFEDHYGVDPGIEPPQKQWDFSVDGLTTENSITEFVDRHMTDEAEPIDDENIDYIHVESNEAFQAYQSFCEANGIDAKPKSKIAELVEVAGCEKKRTRVKGEQATRLIGVVLTESGEALTE